MKRILGHGSRGLGNTDGEKVKSASATDANARHDLIKYSLAASRVSEAALCKLDKEVSPDPTKYFPDVEGNLTKIVWAHAVNSRAELDKALSSEDVMMLEADVVVGNTSNQIGIPIMAHPPADESDLSLENFLNFTCRNNTKKGIKLDFKSDKAFEMSKPILAKLRANLTFPVFLNADIFRGPGGDATTTPLNATEFLKGANEIIPQSIISVGWTTRYEKDNVTESRYSSEQLQSMINALKENNITQSVTYPVRAIFAANDIDGIKTLLKNTTTFAKATLTIWSPKDDPVDAAKLSKLIKAVGLENVYVDVPKDLKNKLELSAASTMSSAINLGALSMALLVLLRML